MFTVREFDIEKDYRNMAEWAKSVGNICPQVEILPGFGCIVEYEGMKCACAFLYMDNSSPVSFIEWFYFNPEISSRIKYVSAQHVVKCLTGCACESGHPVIFTSSKFTGINKIYKKEGFIEAVDGMTHLVKPFNGGDL